MYAALMEASGLRLARKGAFLVRKSTLLPLARQN
jgi:hypothetical protein